MGPSRARSSGNIQCPAADNMVFCVTQPQPLSSPGQDTREMAAAQAGGDEAPRGCSKSGRSGPWLATVTMRVAKGC